MFAVDLINFQLEFIIWVHNRAALRLNSATQLADTTFQIKDARYNIYNRKFSKRYPPLWSSGQSSWLQIRRPGFDSWHYQKKKVVGLERGPLSLVSTTEELLDRKVAAPV
jgi:hypothetical protein